MQKVEYRLGVFPLSGGREMDIFISERALDGYTLSRITPCGSDPGHVIIVMERPVNSPSMRKPVSMNPLLNKVAQFMTGPYSEFTSHGVIVGVGANLDILIVDESGNLHAVPHSYVTVLNNESFTNTIHNVRGN